MDWNKVKVIIILGVSTVFNFLGILAVPVFCLVGCNIIDYITGLIASRYRDENINSYKSFKGIAKKVCMWLLVVVGCIVDILIKYAAQNMGMDFNIPFIVATIVSVWLITNELISILENMVDIGTPIPPFLLPLIKYIQKTTDKKVEDVIPKEDDDNE